MLRVIYSLSRVIGNELGSIDILFSSGFNSMSDKLFLNLLTVEKKYFHQNVGQTLVVIWKCLIFVLIVLVCTTCFCPI